MTKLEMIRENGFTEITSEAIELLKGKNTKSAQIVLDRIINSEYYHIFKNDEGTVICKTRFLVTGQEKSIFKSLLKSEYIEAGNYFDSIGKWAEWVSAN